MRYLPLILVCLLSLLASCDPSGTESGKFSGRLVLQFNDDGAIIRCWQLKSESDCNCSSLFTSMSGAMNWETKGLDVYFKDNFAWVKVYDDRWDEAKRVFTPMDLVCHPYQLDHAK
jgi:hypothetical protein